MVLLESDPGKRDDEEDDTFGSEEPVEITPEESKELKRLEDLMRSDDSVDAPKDVIEKAKKALKEREDEDKKD